MPEVGSDRWWLNRLAPLRYLKRTIYPATGKRKGSLAFLPPTAPPLAVRSDAPQAIRNGLTGYAQLSRYGGLARLLDQVGPLTPRGLQLGFEPRQATLERVQVPLLGRRQVPTRSRHALKRSSRAFYQGRP